MSGKWSVAALVVVGLITAGCSNGPAASAAAGNTTQYNQALAFAKCMRTNGVAAFPDPAASGEMTLDGILNGSSLDPESSAWKQATGACKDLEPAGFTGTKRSAEQQAA